MAMRAITYVWKMTRPTLEEEARRIMAVAYQTAVLTDVSNLESS